jgi:hypothetical protein
LVRVGGTYYAATISVSGLDNNVWYHAVGTYDGGTVTLYLNGAFVDDNTNPSGSITSNNNPICIGSEATVSLDCTGGAYFNGTIDDVMIFNRSLSAEEITALYANTSTTYLEHNFTGLADGRYHTFKAYTQDIAGNVNSTGKRSVFTDANPPSITLNSPVDNSNLNISNVTFNWTATDATNITCNLTIDGLVNKSNLNLTSGVPYNETVEGLSDSVHYWNVTCWDSLNNTATSSTYQIIVDTVFPTINFTDPTPDDGNTTQTDWIYVNVTANDTNNISVVIDFDDSLVSWWRFDDVNGTGHPVDYMNRNNGTKQYDARQVDNGYLGKGFEFDGVSDRIHIADLSPDAQVDESTNFTYSAWLKLNKIAGGWSSIMATEPGYNMLMVRNIEVRFWQGTSSIATGIAPETGKWYHVAVTYINNGSARIYINGVVNATGNIYDPYAKQDYLCIGTDIWGTFDLNGTIDDVMIFNRSLSAEEIAALYANSSTKYLEHNFTSLMKPGRGQ